MEGKVATIGSLESRIRQPDRRRANDINDRRQTREWWDRKTNKQNIIVL